MRALFRFATAIAASVLAVAPVAAQDDLATVFSTSLAWLAPMDRPPVSSPGTRPGRRSMRAARSAPDGSGRLFSLVTATALLHGVPPRLAHAIVRVESGYRCDLRGGGIMQVLPRTARGVGVTGDLRDCATGLEAGMRYLRRAVEAGGPGCVGASLYNTGLGGRRGCTGYGRRVMAFMGLWEASPGRGEASPERGAISRAGEASR